MTRNKVEYAAFRSSRLVGFFLSKASTRLRSSSKWSGYSPFGARSKSNRKLSRAARCSNFQ
ncbi:hypothetical protein [Mesorhizobium sp. M0219]|uniref:hypothetical protein n=1 Tax=Mesorhizobium sp. M0219 TaxID=2956919 RepID=UPI00333C7B49